jgi:HSP20 family protein
MPGIDPKDVSVEVAGSTLTIRAGHANAQTQQNRESYRYEQTLTIPQFLDLDRMTAAHHHGMLQLTVPVKDSVKPRRIQIAGLGDQRQKLEDTTRKDDRKQLTTA